MRWGCDRREHPAGRRRDARFSPDGSQFVTTALQGRLWDTATGERIREFDGHRGIVPYARFTPDGARLLTWSSDRTIKA
jgi:WD40 repeat protein